MRVADGKDDFDVVGAGDVAPCNFTLAQVDGDGGWLGRIGHGAVGV